MTDEIYVVYNKLSNRYESVFSFPTDAVCINHLKNGKFKRDEYDVCKIGKIRILDGVADTHSPIRLEVPEFEEEKLPVEEVK